MTTDEPDGISLEGAENFFTTGSGENNYLEVALGRQKAPPDPME